MNRYGRMAQRLLQEADPARYATIADPQAHFTELGEQLEAEIQREADRLAGPDPAGEGYLEKVRRLNGARLQAEELVLAELAAPTPEPPAA